MGMGTSRTFTSGRTLAPCVIDNIVGIICPRQDNLGDGHKGIALLEEGFNNAWQCLRSVEGGIVEQDNGAWLDLVYHPLSNLRG